MSTLATQLTLLGLLALAIAGLLFALKRSPGGTR